MMSWMWRGLLILILLVGAVGALPFAADPVSPPARGGEETPAESETASSSSEVAARNAERGSETTTGLEPSTGFIAVGFAADPPSAGGDPSPAYPTPPIFLVLCAFLN